MCVSVCVCVCVSARAHTGTCASMGVRWEGGGGPGHACVWRLRGVRCVRGCCVRGAEVRA